MTHRKIISLVIFSFLMLLVSGLLLAVAKDPIFDLGPFESATVNEALNYQLSALPVAVLAAAVTFLFAGKEMISFLSLNRNGTMKSFIGRPGEGRWETDGWTIGLIMAAVMGIGVLLQTLPNGFDFHWQYVLLVIPFAASNALVEEVIFRLSYVSAGKSMTSSVAYGLVMSTAVFGVLHYWGVMPSGLFGAVAAMFLGYFLAKSIQETKGFFWAFMIHFMLDVVIFLFILNLA